MGRKGACLVGDGVEHGGEVPHVCTREDGGEHLALLLVRRALSKQEPGADNEVPKTVRASAHSLPYDEHQRRTYERASPSGTYPGP